MSPSGYAQAVEEWTAGGIIVAEYVYGLGLDPVSMGRDPRKTTVSPAHLGGSRRPVKEPQLRRHQRRPGIGWCDEPHLQRERRLDN